MTKPQKQSHLQFLLGIPDSRYFNIIYKLLFVVYGVLWLGHFVAPALNVLTSEQLLFLGGFLAMTLFVYWLLLKLRACQHQIGKQQLELEALRRLEDIWRTSAATYARGRGKFYRRVSNGKTVDAIAEFEEDLTTQLDQFARVFRVLTDEHCALVVKEVTLDQECLENSRVRSVARDGTSGSKRVGDKLGRHNTIISQDSDFMALIVEQADEWANDELSALGPSFLNSGNFPAEYNALLSVPIPHLAHTDDPSPQKRYILSIDNMKGGLTTDTAKNYAKEIGWTLSVPFYVRDLLVENGGNKGRLQGKR